MKQFKCKVRNRGVNGEMKAASQQSGGRMKGEESSYSKELEQATNGITRKAMKQIECVQQRKKNGLII